MVEEKGLVNNDFLALSLLFFIFRRPLFFGDAQTKSCRNHLRKRFLQDSSTKRKKKIKNDSDEKGKIIF